MFQKFEPKDATELVWPDIIISSSIKFLTSFQEKHRSSRFILLYHSVPGTGKTSGIIALCKSLGYNPIVYNGSNLLTKDVNEIVKTMKYNLENKMNVVIIDEIDRMDARIQKTAFRLFDKKKDEWKFPIVITANDMKKVISKFKYSKTKVYNIHVSFDKDKLRQRLERLGIKNPDVEGKSIREILKNNLMKCNRTMARAETIEESAFCIMSGHPELVVKSLNSSIIDQFHKRGVDWKVVTMLNEMFKRAKEVPWMGRLTNAVSKNVRGSTKVVEQADKIEYKTRREMDKVEIHVEKTGVSLKTKEPIRVDNLDDEW